MTIKYLSLFSGIGGFEVGLANSNYDFECIGYSEIDKYARSIYERHYPNHPYLGDATEIRTEELPDFDLLVGGFPCQAFSVAGKRRGFDDTRGTLFFEIARILKDKRPRYFLLENVRGLLSHDKGKTFQTILKVLSDLGYIVRWQMLNSKDFGVPQRRERVFIEGYFGGRCSGEVLFVGGNDEEDSRRLSNTSYNTRSGRIHKVDEIMNTLTCTGLNGGGVSLSLNPRTCKVDKIKQKALKRKHDVDVVGLQELLKESKKKSELSNKDIALLLDLPETQVAHWFRTDEYFSVPTKEVWFDLKDVLGIADDSFDKALTEFVEVDSEYDMNNRVYSDEGLSPTLKCNSKGELIKEHKKREREL